MVTRAEDNDSPLFGLITLGALSPCLFTLQQQPGNEGVNAASSESTASISATARELRRLLGSSKAKAQPVKRGVHVKFTSARVKVRVSSV